VSHGSIVRRVTIFGWYAMVGYILKMVGYAQAVWQRWKIKKLKRLN
tara:strand:- start:3386 stop:3523 length:138 start_codon:yes stop_codon:yes gene_type:complete